MQQFSFYQMWREIHMVEAKGMLQEAGFASNQKWFARALYGPQAGETLKGAGRIEFGSDRMLHWLTATGPLCTVLGVPVLFSAR